MKARAIVGHGINGARDVEHFGEVLVVPLVEGGETEKVGAGAGVGDGAAAVPRDGSDVVTHGVSSRLAARDKVDDDILVEDGTRQLEVTVGKRTGRVCIRDELGLNCWRPFVAPQNRREQGGRCQPGRGHDRREPHAPRTGFGGIARADLSGGRGNDFGNTRGSRRHILGKGPEVLELVVDLGGESDAAAVAMTKGKLEVREQATAPGDGEDHAAQFTQQAVPNLEGYTFAPSHVAKDFQEPRLTVGWQLDCFPNGVDEPPQDNFERAPAGITFEQLFHGDNLPATCWVSTVVWAEGVVDGVHEDAANAIDMGGASLGKGDEVIDVDVDVGGGGCRVSAVGGVFHRARWRRARG